MTLFSVAWKNMKGDMRSYLLYFLSMLFSVVVYYTFVSLKYSTEIQKGLESSDIMSSLFNGASIILIVFVCIFILYSNSFFTKKRKKEVGLYSLLGVKKRTIGLMLFYESMVISSLVIVAGIFVGTLLSKLFSMMLLKLLDINIEIGMNFSWAAIVNTVTVFAIITLFTSIQAYRLIYRFRLIELFQAEKEREEVPTVSTISSVIAVVLIGIGYWQLLTPIESNAQFGRIMLIGILCMLIGTYLLFRSLLVYMLKAFQKNKSRYYQGTRFISISQLLFRVRANTKAFTIIALLNGIVLSLFGVVYSQYYISEKMTKAFAPFSYQHVAMDEAFNKKIASIIEEDKEHKVTGKIDIPVIKVSGTASETVLIPRYFEISKTPIKVVSTSTFNQVSSALHRETTVHVADNEAVAILPAATKYTLAQYQEQPLTLKLPKETKTLHFKSLVEDRVANWSFPDFYVIVSDKLFADMSKQLPVMTLQSYEVEEEKTAKITGNNLKELATEDNQLSSFYVKYRGNLESSAIILFVAGFVGSVFLMATGSIIYFKQLTEAHADKNRYEILAKLGVGKKEIRIAIAKQNLFTFALPLGVGGLHSAVLLKMASGMYSDLIGVNLLIPIMISVSAYFIIYCGYYVLTTTNFIKIVES